MSFSASDLAAVERVAGRVLEHPNDIHEPQLEALRRVISKFGGVVPPKKEEPKAAPAAAAAEEPTSEPDEERWASDSVNAKYDVPTSGTPSDADEERAMEVKAAAQDLASEGNVEAALEKLTEALRLTPGKAMYWALRSSYFLQLKKPVAAIEDATRALSINSENARALRVRGTAYRHLGRWEESAHDLNEAQVVDYDEGVQELLSVVQPKANHKRDARRHKELDEQNRRQEELRRQRQREQEAEAEEAAKASAASGGFPGGMPGGFPGAGAGGFPGAGAGGFPGAGGIPPGMEALFSDPEIVAAMQDPEVAPKLAQLMSNPAAAMQMMGDPKMGPLIQKIMAKMMGGGMGGMGGMPGMGGMGGMPGGFPGGMPRGGFGGGAPRGAAPPKGNNNDDLD
ncbi:Hsc70-interacting protein, putative [Bodo saltans]|uniref:Hsc70-interacting protein, putative n=1 Tax=Bodo saltans TaxID=75058 RepID=A0A0S4JHA5_BODSA|nr:Hsc70-interacting protein, putative [Bodo saltans]|eukprot:CUG89536.1 Hsc70-interacting protein, putative [Bodo saltans]